MTLREWAEWLEKFAWSSYPAGHLAHHRYCRAVALLRAAADAADALDELRGWNTTAPSFVVDQANAALAALRAAEGEG